MSNIFRVSADQLPECLAILSAAYEASARDFGMTEQNCPHRGRTRLPLSVLAQEFSDGCRMYGCRYDDRFAGFLSIGVQEDVLHINDLAILPEFQSRGIGAMLMRHAISLAEAEEFRVIELGMVHDNIRLRKWYEGFGFRTIHIKQYPAVTYAVGTMQLNIESPSSHFKEGFPMKIAVSSYSFTQAVNDGRMTMLDVIPKAKEMGFDGIEIVRMNQTDEEMLTLAEQLHAQSVELNFPIVAYMVSNDFLKESLDDCVARLTRELNIAKVLGAPAMRHDATTGVTADGKQLTFEEALPVIAEGYRRVTEIAAEMGIRTMIENHGYFAQDALRVKKLVETVGHPNFGWLCDMGNFMCADEVSVESVKIAAPMAVHAHAKDFHWKSKTDYLPEGQGWFPTRDGNQLRGAIIGHGVVNVPECLKILREAGYDNWLSTEFEGIEDCIMALEADIKNLRSILA